MNYLKKNLGNSIELPADVMRLVYEYADPLIAIRKQIENADYSLDEIMYQRMKKYLKIHLILDYYILENYSAEDVIEINENNINDRNLKDGILNNDNGYKNLFLCRHKRHQSICGLIHPSQNIMDFEDCLNYVDKNITKNIHNYTHYPADGIHPADGNLSKYYIREMFAVWRTI